MGGDGSGRRAGSHFDRKTCVDEISETLRLSDLQKQGKLMPGSSFPWGFAWFIDNAEERLYRFLSENLAQKGALDIEVCFWDDDWYGYGEGDFRPFSLQVTHLWANGGYRERAPSQMIEVCATSCYFGGYRLWMVCPDCEERREVLYPRSIDPQTGKCDFGLSCRVCLEYAYGSRMENFASRAARRAKKKRYRIGGLFAQPLDKQVPDRPKGMHQTTYQRLVKAAVADTNIVFSYWNARCGAMTRQTDRFLASAESSSRRMKRRH